MTATNHAVFGMIIMSAAPHPAIGLPAALVSHFLLDAAPHFGRHPGLRHDSRNFLVWLTADAAIASSLMLSIAILQPTGWPLIIAGALLAMSPDLMWLPGYLRTLKNQKPLPLNALSRWHARIQWGERPWGMAIELPWFILTFSVLLQTLAP